MSILSVIEQFISFFLQNDVEKYFAQLGECGNASLIKIHDAISFRDYVFFCFCFFFGGGGGTSSLGCPDRF